MNVQKIIAEFQKIHGCQVKKYMVRKGLLIMSIEHEEYNVCTIDLDNIRKNQITQEQLK